MPGVSSTTVGAVSTGRPRGDRMMKAPFAGADRPAATAAAMQEVRSTGLRLVGASLEPHAAFERDVGHVEAELGLEHGGHDPQLEGVIVHDQNAPAGGNWPFSKRSE